MKGHHFFCWQTAIELGWVYLSCCSSSRVITSGHPLYSTKMLWKWMWALASVFTNPFRAPVDPNLQKVGPEGFYDTDRPYNAKPHGPQSWHEAQQAAYALYGHGSDMILDEDDGPSYAAIKGDMYRWPNKTVPYVMSGDIAKNKTMVKLVNDAIKHIESRTCVKFVLRTNEKEYVYIIRDDKKCYAQVGYEAGATVRYMSLGEGCQYLGTVIHEWLHILGCNHEHQRSDRDKHIKIFSHNIIPSEMHNFNISDPNKESIFNIAYDYDSIMQYGSFSFSKNISAGLATMATLNLTLLLEPWEKPGMTKNDVQLVLKMYKC